MESTQATMLTVEATINVPVSIVWDCWTKPAHITQWCFASDDWHAPSATNDLRVGGSFSSRMEAKDGSVGFDFSGIYDAISTYEYIAYTLGDGRKVNIRFIANGVSTNVVENFEAESENPLELQQGGWQAILNNFKLYAETI